MRSQLASLDLLKGLDQLEAGTIDEDTFNQRYGHRGPHEFEISLPRSGEDPAWLASQRAQRNPGDHRPSSPSSSRSRRQIRELAWIRLDHRFPLQAWLLRRQVQQWGRIARNRELARSEVIRYFWVLRAFVVRAGELTGLGDDIFFLDLDEIVDALGGERARRATRSPTAAGVRRYAALPPLPGLIRGRFDPFAWAADPSAASTRVSTAAHLVAGGAETSRATVTGFPGSAGVVEGTARVILVATDGDAAAAR